MGGKVSQGPEGLLEAENQMTALLLATTCNKT